MLAVKAFSAAKFDPEAAQKKAEAEWSAKTPQEKEASFDLLRSIETATDGSFNASATIFGTSATNNNHFTAT